MSFVLVGRAVVGMLPAVVPTVALPSAGTGWAVSSDTLRTIEAPPDTAYWELQGRATVAEYKGRKSLRLDGGAAGLRNFTMRDAVIDFDVATPAAGPGARGFFGIEFRADSTGQNSEFVYLRPHKSGQPDAIQYTPVLATGLNWQLYSGPGFTGPLDLPRDTWYHVRLAVAGSEAKLYVGDMDEPALVMGDLKSGRQTGTVDLAVLTGVTYFSNFVIRETPEVPWTRHFPAMPPGTLTHWQLSPSYEALDHDVEQPLTAADAAAIPWQDVEAEPPGLVAIYRYRDAPHLRVTFEYDFSTRLQPQPGTRLVYARTSIDSDRDQVRKLNIGYSDEVSVFLNGRILFRGRSAQSFRDPRFLGIVSPEDDAVYLPLKKGRNDLVLAVSELGGGWGFICRLADPGQ